MVRVEFLGISLTAKGAHESPQQNVSCAISELSTLSAGKLFVAMRTLEAGPLTLRLEVDGELVEIYDNEKTLQNLTRIRPEHQTGIIPIELPMRIIGKEDQQFPAEHSIRILWADPAHLVHGWDGAHTFMLTITGTQPVVKYNPKTDGD